MLSQACATLQPGLFSILPSGKTVVAQALLMDFEPATATRTIDAITLASYAHLRGRRICLDLE
jgi:hypothetical protein